MSVPARFWALAQDTKGSERQVLNCLADWMIGNDAVVCWPSVETIAFETGCNRQTVMKATASLKQAGLITKKRRLVNDEWRMHYTLVGYVPSEWVNTERPTFESTKNRKYEKPDLQDSVRTGNSASESPKNRTSESTAFRTLESTETRTRTGNNKEDKERNKEDLCALPGARSAIAAVASAQAQTPYPEDFDQSLFEEAEREARSFPEPLPEPPAQPPVEQPASTPARPKMAYPPCQYEKVVELYHANCRGLRRVLALTDARKRTINARWREFCKEDDLKTTAEALESFEWYFQEVSKSRFLMGYSTPGPGRDRPFKADFDWLMCPTNFLKVCEGKYSNGPKN